MGDTILADRINGEPQASYTILSYPATALPDAYVNMILSNWMKSFRYLNDYVRLWDQSNYYEVYERLIRGVLARPSASVRLAVLSDDYDVCLGWSVCESPATLHYVFVRDGNRGEGIARALVPDSIDTITHLTRPALPIWTAKLPKAKFKP